MTLHKDGIKYDLLRPGYPVDIFVDHYLVARGFPTIKDERVFPNNEIELFFNFGDINYGQLMSERPNVSFVSSILSGLRSTFMRIIPGRYFHIAGIRFTLFGFYHLFKIPASEIVDGNFDADLVLGPEIKTLRQGFRGAV